MKEQYSRCTNRDMKTSVLLAVIDGIPDKRALHLSIELLSIHSDEPELWRKIQNHFNFGSAQSLDWG